MSKQRSLLALVIIAIIGLGIGATLYLNHITNTQNYARLIQRAQSAAALIDAEDLAPLSLSAADLERPEYQKVKRQLVELKQKNPDVRFAYLMALRGNQVYFIVDSEDPLSPDYSPPGQEYTEASSALLSGWNPQVPYVFEFYADRWGDWISALAPVKGAEGATVALLGFDQDAKAHRAQFMMGVGLILLATIALLTIVGLLCRLQSKEQELLEMKSDFLAAAAHELRSPLSGIRWALSSLRNDVELSQTARTSVNDIYERIRGLVDLTSTFLLSASTDHGIMRTEELKIVNLAPTIAEAVKHSTMLAQSKHMHINVTFPLSESIILRADAARLRLVFENLLSNAIKYSPPNSTVTLSYEGRGSVRVFSVTDQGIGIPKGDENKIFSGYHRATNAKKSGILGSGFGLYMVKKIVDFHGGSIEAHSSPGGGTTFTVRLPAGV